MLIKVETPDAPKPIGPYSQAVRAGQFLFISGTLAVDPATGQLLGESVEEQTEQVLKNIEAILSDQGLTFENVVKCEVYLKDITGFTGMNRVYATRFTHAVKPARQGMQVGALPLNALVEISCIAFYP
jgi:2-iminobutanoate/2-iminopropanoate deaminase